MQFAFGTGNLYGLVLSNGVYVPRKFGVLNDVSVDFSATLKPLYGQNQYAFAFGKGQTKIQGKATFANLNGPMLNDLFFGGSSATGQTVAQIGESGSIPASPAYTVQVANHTTWVDDLGVTYALSGQPLTRVASGPTQGQYSVAAGVYTFAAADQGLAVVLDYTYTIATGNTTTIMNTVTGQAPMFITVLPFLFNGKNFLLHFAACASSKLSLASKAEDFTIPEFDFMAGANDSGLVGYLSLAE